MSPRAIGNWVTATWVAAGAGCFMSLLWKHLLVGFDPYGAFEGLALLAGVVSVVFSSAFGGTREYNEKGRIEAKRRERELNQ